MKNKMILIGVAGFILNLSSVFAQDSFSPKDQERVEENFKKIKSRINEAVSTRKKRDLIFADFYETLKKTHGDISEQADQKLAETISKLTSLSSEDFIGMKINGKTSSELLELIVNTRGPRSAGAGRQVIGYFAEKNSLGLKGHDPLPSIESLMSLDTEMQKALDSLLETQNQCTSLTSKESLQEIQRLDASIHNPKMTLTEAKEIAKKRTDELNVHYEELVEKYLKVESIDRYFDLDVPPVPSRKDNFYELKTLGTPQYLLLKDLKESKDVVVGFEYPVHIFVEKKADIPFFDQKPLEERGSENWLLHSDSWAEILGDFQQKLFPDSHLISTFRDSIRAVNVTAIEELYKVKEQHRQEVLQFLDSDAVKILTKHNLLQRYNSCVVSLSAVNNDLVKEAGASDFVADIKEMNPNKWNDLTGRYETVRSQAASVQHDLKSLHDPRRTGTWQER